MAKERGWWKISYGDLRSQDLNDSDLEHIAQCIRDGYIEGEIAGDDE